MSEIFVELANLFLIVHTRNIKTDGTSCPKSNISVAQSDGIFFCISRPSALVTTNGPQRPLAAPADTATGDRSLPTSKDKSLLSAAKSYFI